MPSSTQLYFGSARSSVTLVARPMAELRLPKVDFPIHGQVVDLEGRPVAGATVRRQRIETTAEEDLSYLFVVKGKRFSDCEPEFLEHPEHPERTRLFAVVENSGH